MNKVDLTRRCDNFGDQALAIGKQADLYRSATALDYDSQVQGQGRLPRSALLPFRRWAYAQLEVNLATAWSDFTEELFLGCVNQDSSKVGDQLGLALPKHLPRRSARRCSRHGSFSISAASQTSKVPVRGSWSSIHLPRSRARTQVCWTSWQRSVTMLSTGVDALVWSTTNAFSPPTATKTLWRQGHFCSPSQELATSSRDVFGIQGRPLKILERPSHRRTLSIDSVLAATRPPTGGCRQTSANTNGCPLTPSNRPGPNS